MEEVNPETMREVEQDQLKSTYQSDYTGIPQGKSSEKNNKICTVSIQIG